MESGPKIDRNLLLILNQVYDIQRKLEKIDTPNSISRNVNRIKQVFEESLFPAGQGLVIHDPQGEPFDETRTDCEASISGDSTENLFIREVVKPIIRLKQGEISMIVQKGVVVVGP